MPTLLDNCGMTQSIAFIMCKDENEAKNISTIMNHPLYNINNICRYEISTIFVFYKSFLIVIIMRKCIKILHLTQEEIKFLNQY